jgi:hypothetical protein
MSILSEPMTMKKLVSLGLVVSGSVGVAYAASAHAPAQIQDDYATNLFENDEYLRALSIVSCVFLLLAGVAYWRYRDLVPSQNAKGLGMLDVNNPDSLARIFAMTLVAAAILCLIKGVNGHPPSSGDDPVGYVRGVADSRSSARDIVLAGSALVLVAGVAYGQYLRVTRGWTLMG